MAQPTRISLVPAGDAPVPPSETLRPRPSAFLGDSVLMAGGSAATAITGFAFWWVAAHMLPAATVGLASAAVAAMGLVALAAEFGLGPLLIGELPRRPGERARLVATSLAASACAAFCLGVLLLGTALVSAPADLRAAAADPVPAAAFLVGCALTTLSAVLDQALIGLRRSALQVARALLFGFGRLVPLAALGAAGLAGGPGSILGSWLFGLALPLAIGLVLAGPTAWHRPSPALLRPHLGRAGAHHLMNAAIVAPGLALPILAATLLGPAAAAPFYAALMVLSAALILPAALATRFQVADAGPSDLAGRLRLSLGLSCFCAACAAILFGTASAPLLGVLGPGYPALAGDGLRLLGLVAFAIIVKFHFLAIVRYRGRLLAGGCVLAAGAVVEIAAAALGAVSLGGLGGAVTGWLAGSVVEAAAMLPTVLREASGRSRTAP